jgi:hypothetical protein
MHDFLVENIEDIFDNYTVIDSDASIIKYYKYYSDYTFGFHISPHEGDVIISFYSKAVIYYTFVIDIRNMTQTLYNKNEITLLRENNFLPVSISLIPHFNITHLPSLNVKDLKTIKFDQYDLLEHLACLPTVIDEPKKIYEYIPEPKNGIYLKFYFSATDNYVRVFWGPGLNNPWCDIGFINVTQLICTQEKIVIIQNDDSNEDLFLELEPYFSLHCSL